MLRTIQDGHLRKDAYQKRNEEKEMFKTRKFGWIAGLMLVTVLLAACNGETRPGSVSVLDGGSTSVSGSVSGIGDIGAVSGGLGGYDPVSGVENHSMVSLDIADINAVLSASPIDWDEVKRVYESGEHSKSGEGNRTLAGFARSEGRSEPIWNDYTAYYGDPVWLDTFVLSAIEGTGSFAGAADGVRIQATQKGVQNQVMVAWAIHEMVAAMAKAADGNFDLANGAPHNWDEAWAFYHGVDPVNSPYSTADKRGGNFGMGDATNVAILAAMQAGQVALADGDAAGAQAAMDNVIKQLRITYTQATIRYASLITADLDAGDEAKAREHQAEGGAFYRVIEPMVAGVDTDVANSIAAAYEIGRPLDANAAARVASEISKVYAAWGVTNADIGTLQ